MVDSSLCRLFLYCTLNMFRLFVITVLLAVSSALDVSLNGEWEGYKKTYSKNYGELETMRRMIWEKNVAYIQQHNLEADRGIHTFRLGMNEYGDMTNAEFRAIMNGYRMNSTVSRPVGSTFLPPSNLRVEDLPTTVDWRTKGLVTPVKNQGQCGSCWAFSTTGSLEGQTMKKSGQLPSLSEQNLVDCSGKEGNQGCNGGLMDQAFAYIKQNGGIDTEASYPYEAKDDTCRYNPSNRGATDVGFSDIKTGSESDLQTAVATVGPISVAIDASHMSFQLYKSGVYHSFFCSKTRLDHGVLAAGYGTESGKDYWLVKNSWGGSWGEQGYIKMSRNRDNNCGIATQASYPLL